MTENKDFNIALFVLKLSTQHSAHIIRMASLVIYKIMVDLIPLQLTNLQQMRSFKGGIVDFSCVQHYRT